MYNNRSLYHSYLMHHGVKGMKWGRRKSQYGARIVRGHAGSGRYLTRKRQLAGDKRDLERLNNGQHLSVGLTKKRQAAYDARDRRNLENRIAKNEKHFANKAEKKAAKVYQKAYMKDAEAAYKRAGIKNFNPKTGDYTIDKNGTYRHKKTGAVISKKDFKMAWDYAAEQRYRKERAQQWLVASPILAVSAASIVAVGADYALNKR